MEDQRDGQELAQVSLPGCTPGHGHSLYFYTGCIFMCICICICLGICICICVCIVSVFVSSFLSIFVSARLAMDLVYIFTRSVFSCAFVSVLVSGYTGLEQKKASKGSPAENCYIRIILHFCFLCFSRIFVSLLVCWIVGEDDDHNACELPVTGCSFGPSQLTG